MEVTLADKSKITCHDEPKGSGGEGEVFFSTDDRYAIKLYSRTDPNRQSFLQTIISKYSSVHDQGLWKPLFCWPDAIVIAPRLGVRMPRAAADLRSLDHFLLTKYRNLTLNNKERGNWAGYISIAIKMARILRRLNNSGLCYADPSWNNFLVNANDGRVTAIDLDGLVVPDMLTASVTGTPEFQAPELVIGKVSPSISTDLHSLAVLIYRTLVFYNVPSLGWGSVHPLGFGKTALFGSKKHEGAANQNEVEIHAFGDQAVFIEHPTDHSNRPKLPQAPGNKPHHQFAGTRVLGPDIEKLVHGAFVEGLHHPYKRPQAGQWEEALVKLRDRVIPCSNQACEMQCFAVLESGNVQCPWCGTRPKTTDTLAVLRMYRHVLTRQRQFEPDGHYMIVSWPKRTLHDWHIFTDKLPGYTSFNPTRAHFEFSTSTKAWILHNDDIDDLIVKDSSGKRTISPKCSFELKEAQQIIFGNTDQSRSAYVHIMRL